MIPVNQIAAVLGGARILRKRLESIQALDASVSAGLPKASLRETASRIFTNRSEQKRLMNRIVPEATYKRRRERLSAAESERTERVARVVATAEHTWDDREDARRFLTTPHPALAGKTPIDAAMTELGARQVEEILGKIFHGLPA
jgi:putative toxin-antitoxin system antitoxin component (TIGR02293 family)